MADEIQIPLKLYPHRTNNANATWDQLTQTTNLHQAGGWRFRNGEIADINGKLSRPIPSNINVVPAGEIRVHWVTDTATANDVKFFIYVIDIAYNTTSVDPAAWDDSLTVVDANSGQYIENECSVSIVTATLTSGRGLRMLMRRDSTDPADTLAADVIVTDVLLIADQT